MALLNKLFVNRKKSCKQTSKTNSVLETSRWDTPPFSKDQIRVLVFRECEWRGRKLLFDWKSIKKTEPGVQLSAKDNQTCLKGDAQHVNQAKIEGYTEVAQNGVVYQYMRPRPDVKMLGEMIFGSVAMSYKGVALKIHNIRSPPQLMFSKVFPAPVPSSTDSDRELEGSNSLQNSISECYSIRKSQAGTSCSVAHSVPVDVPMHMSSLRAEDDLKLITPSSLRSNGSFNSAHSFQRSPEGSNNSLNSLTRSGSFNSLHRRWLRTVATSMEFGLKRMSAENIHAEDKHIPNNRRTKLGISVVLSLSEKEDEERDFQAFFFSHITLVEGYLNKLSMAVEKAYRNRRQFVHLVMEGVEILQQALYDLYVAPRFPEPVWLSMMATGAQQHTLSLQFITELMNLLELHDNKTTNFFISTLLTAVLTHHLAWVPTVTPSGILPSQSFHEKHRAKWLDILAKLRPYNPLWVQLGDLYGALGSPCKMAKTVIVGNNADLVRQIMYCLTYFIRCCEVYENAESRLSPPPRHHVMSSSSTSSGSTILGDPLQAFQHDLMVTPQVSYTANDEMEMFVDRTPERSSGGLRNSGRSLSNLPNLLKSEVSVGVERQDGEGEESDDVFHEDQAQIRRHNCAICKGACLCKRKSNRHGMIFEDVERISGLLSDSSRDSPLTKATGESQTCRLIRDSGIDSYVEMESESRVRLLLNNAQNKDCPTPAARTKRKGAGTKVVFTIGNIPLEEICSPTRKGEREQSPTNDVLVCTCGKHVRGPSDGKGTLLGSKSPQPKTFNGLDGCKPPQLSLSAVNAKLIQIDDRRTDLLVGENCHSETGMSKNSSLTCDSGIHSCEDSRIDLTNSRSYGTAPVTAVNISLPRVKLEHVRNVGNARVADRNIMATRFTTSFIHLPGDAVSTKNGSDSWQSHQENGCSSPASKCDPPSNACAHSEQTSNESKHRTFDYSRSSSMFDEYFDENIELKMLDEQSFQERLKESRTRDNSKVKLKSTAIEMPNGFNCQCNSMKCVSRDSLLDGQEERFCCDTLPSPSLMSWCETPQLNDRAVMWNTSVPIEENQEFFDRVYELQMPMSEVKQSSYGPQALYTRSFGWSLLSNYVDHYMSDFALQGTNDTNFGEKLLCDLRTTVQNCVLDEEVAEALCIVANTDNWTVEVVSSRYGTVSDDGSPVGVRVTTSQLVVGMTEALLHLWKLKMSPEFCMMHLEDRLQEFYFKSRLLVEYFTDNDPFSDVEKVASDLGVDTSDLPILFAISSIHS